MGLKPVCFVVQTGRLGWFSYAECTFYQGRYEEFGQ